MAAVNPVDGLELPDDRLDRLATFEQLALFIGQPLVLAPVFDLNIWIVFSHIHGTYQQCFRTLLTQSFTEAPQLCRIAWALVLEILVAGKVMPAGRLVLAPDHDFVALIKRMLEMLPPTITVTRPNRSKPSIFLPALSFRAQR